MKFLLLQTFAWMVSTFFVGAILGCMGRRLFGVASADETAIWGSGATAAAAPAASVVIKKSAEAPVIQARSAPAPVMPAAPAGGLERAGSAYNYPVSTVGIPRGAPDPVQPQIQRIDLTLADAAAAVGSPQRPAATASAPSPVRAAPALAPAQSRIDYPITTIGIPAGLVADAIRTYPVTTIGIPAGYVAPPAVARPASAPAVAHVAPAGAVARETSQPRPEPLRPELARAAAASASSTAMPPAASVAASVSKEPAATVAPPADKPAASEPAEQPFTPVAPSAAAASALAARAMAQAPAPASPPAAASSPGDDLTRIRSIDETLQTRLRGAGVTRLADIARWSPDDVNRISQTLGLTSRIGAENWIEQAQILASGAETEYSRRRQRGEIASAAVTPAAETAEPTRAPNVTSMAERAAAMAAAAAAAATAAATVAPAPQAAKLADAIRESSAATDAAARTPRPDLANLRSVRSEALRGDVTASETLRSGGPARGIGSYDDLKRIRGIGVLIEKKLNSLGITTYEHVANWTNADIERVSQILDFKGRVERESWVEQARILASGGQTDFASRVDRGEV